MRREQSDSWAPRAPVLDARAEPASPPSPLRRAVARRGRPTWRSKSEGGGAPGARPGSSRQPDAAGRRGSCARRSPSRRRTGEGRSSAQGAHAPGGRTRFAAAREARSAAQRASCAEGAGAPSGRPRFATPREARRAGDIPSRAGGMRAPRCRAPPTATECRSSAQGAHAPPGRSRFQQSQSRPREDPGGPTPENARCHELSTAIGGRVEQSTGRRNAVKRRGNACPAPSMAS